MRIIYTTAFKRFFIAITLIAFFVIGSATGILDPLKSWTQGTFGAASKFISSGINGVKDFAATVGTISRLARENAELNQQVDELSFENARLQTARNENSALRRALGFSDSLTFEAIPAEVRAQDPTGFSQTIVINKGSNDGVVIGQAVIVQPGVLVGRITRVTASTSEATLITDPSMTINGEIADSGARGLIKGEHGISLILDLVTQNELLKSGDRVITSGLSGDFPRGLLVGEISAIKTSSSELFQQAYVTPTTDLRNLKFVFVVK